MEREKKAAARLICLSARLIPAPTQLFVSLLWIKMAKKKYKKDIKVWEQFLDSCIAAGAKDEIKRIKRRYNKHRAKNKGAD